MTGRPWIRFAVGDRLGNWAPTWKLWLNECGPQCIHVGSRGIGGRCRFTRRDRLDWRGHFVPAEGEGQPAMSDPEIRISLTGGTSCSTGRDYAELLRIRTEAGAVTEPDLPGRYRYVTRVPIHAGQANEIRVLVVHRGMPPGAWPTLPLPGMVPLGGLDIGPSSRVIVVYRSIPAVGSCESAGAAPPSTRLSHARNAPSSA